MNADGEAMTQDERLRSLLLAQQERTRIRVERLAADLDALTSARRGESDDDEHDPEGVTLSSQWSMLAGLLESARDEDRQTEEAMARGRSRSPSSRCGPSATAAWPAPSAADRRAPVGWTDP